MFFESIKFETHRLAPRRKITSVTWDKWGRLDIEWKTCPDSGLNREKKGKLIEQRRCTLQNGKHAKHTSRCERPSASQGETTTTHFKAPLSFFLHCNNVLLPYLFPGKDNRSACTARFSFNYFFFLVKTVRWRDLKCGSKFSNHWLHCSTSWNSHMTIKSIQQQFSLATLAWKVNSCGFN